MSCFKNCKKLNVNFTDLLNELNELKTNDLPKFHKRINELWTTYEQYSKETKQIIDRVIEFALNFQFKEGVHPPKPEEKEPF